MKIKIPAALLIGLLVVLQVGLRTRDSTHTRRDRGERGLSHSAETAILLAGAVVVAGIVVTVITALVKSKLTK